MVDRSFHGTTKLGMLVCNIGRFLRIVLEVEELDLVLLNNHFLVAAAHGSPKFGFVSKKNVPVREAFFLE